MNQTINEAMRYYAYPRMKQLDYNKKKKTRQQMPFRRFYSNVCLAAFFGSNYKKTNFVCLGVSYKLPFCI